MAPHLRLWSHHPPAHLIEVAAKWPADKGPHAPSKDCAQSAASLAEVLATYRWHRERLADVVRQTPATPSPREEASVADLFAPDLLEAAAALYDPHLRYHNAGHALRAVTWGERLLRVCSQVGVPVDATVVRLALLFHDAGYGTDLATVGCPDAEAYSAALARRTLTGRVPEPVLEAVEAAILETRLTTQPSTPEGKVVRAADLADLAADYGTFAANSEALRVEHEFLTGTRPSLPEWGESVDRLLSAYLGERLWPLELLDDGAARPGFHAVAKANLRRYVESCRKSADATG